MYYNYIILLPISEYSWVNFVRENPSALIVIYDVNCPNCKAIRSEISECAHLLLTNKVLESCFTRVFLRW